MKKKSRQILEREPLALLLMIMVWTTTVIADEWPQWRGPGRDGVWNETGIVESFESSELKIKWRTEISSGYSGPTVANGLVYVSDRVIEPDQMERVHCFDENTGDAVWSYSYDCAYRNVGYTAGPRASVTLDEGRAYSLGTMGHLYCFDAASAEVLWGHDLDAQYTIRMPIWGIASAPLIEGDLVIVQIGGENESCLVAFNKVTGKEQWHALADRTSYSAPIMIEQGGQRVLVCWTGDRIVGLNPQTAQLYWEHVYTPVNMVLAIASPVVENDHLFVTGFYDGSLMLKIDRSQPTIEKVWRRRGGSERKTDSLHSIMSTPFLDGNYIYGCDSYGELRCLEATTGDRVWEDLTAVPKARWSNIYFVRNADKVWMFNERGELIISRLSPGGFEEISRAKLIEPTLNQLPSRSGRQQPGVCWSHPAFAYRHVFARNDKELVCASLEAR